MPVRVPAPSLPATGKGGVMGVLGQTLELTMISEVGAVTDDPSATETITVDGDATDTALATETISESSAVVIT